MKYLLFFVLLTNIFTISYSQRVTPQVEVVSSKNYNLISFGCLFDEFTLFLGSNFATGEGIESKSNYISNSAVKSDNKRVYTMSLGYDVVKYKDFYISPIISVYSVNSIYTKQSNNYERYYTKFSHVYIDTALKLSYIKDNLLLSVSSGYNRNFSLSVGFNFTNFY